MPSAASIPCLVGTGLGVTIRTDQTTVLQGVVFGVPIDVIKLQRDWLFHPLVQPADRAPGVEIEEVALDYTEARLPCLHFCSSLAAVLAGDRAVFPVWSGHFSTTDGAGRTDFSRLWHCRPLSIVVMHEPCKLGTPVRLWQGAYLIIPGGAIGSAGAFEALGCGFESHPGSQFMPTKHKWRCTRLVSARSGFNSRRRLHVAEVQEVAHVFGKDEDRVRLPTAASGRSSPTGRGVRFKIGMLRVRLPPSASWGRSPILVEAGASEASQCGFESHRPHLFLSA